MRAKPDEAEEARQKEEAEAAKEKLEEEDDQDAIEKARQWDEYTDGNYIATFESSLFWHLGWK